MHSQALEEHWILKALWPLHKAVPGRFLDIGAFHPSDMSNTRALFTEWGWSGVMFEPSPGPMLTLLETYGREPRIELVFGAVTVEPGFVALHVTDDAVSTTDARTFETWNGATTFHGSIVTPGIPVSEIANRWGAFDFVNLDAEGCSTDLFLEMMRLGWAPRCFCVEHDGRLNEILAAARQYRQIYENGTNVVLARKDP